MSRITERGQTIHQGFEVQCANRHCTAFSIHGAIDREDFQNTLRNRGWREIERAWRCPRCAFQMTGIKAGAQ
jgi:cytochrome c-type biogenesis protein CcmH/NrfF